MCGKQTQCLCACMKYIFCGLAVSAKPALLYKREEAQGQVAYNRALGFSELKPPQMVGVREHRPAGNPSRGLD